MKVLIIDDERPARSELKYLISRYWQEAEITEASSGEQALLTIARQAFDIAFVDINLGDISGMVVAEMLKRNCPGIEVVFATAYNDYAEKAFMLEALHYILKPFDGEKIRQVLERFEARKQQEKKAVPVSKLMISSDKKMLLIDIDQIVYIETQQRHCVVHIAEKSYVSSGTISQYEEKLREKGFFRIQKSFLINLHYVTELYQWFQNTTCVKMKGYEEKVIPISRNKLKDLKEVLFI